MSSRPPLGPGLRARVALGAVALGALALVAVPSRTPSPLELDAQRRHHALRLARAELLGAIEDYRDDHGAWPGLAPEGGHDRPHSALVLREQLLRSTDARGRPGGVDATGALDSPRYPFGPYLGSIPANPLDSSSTLHVVDRDAADPTSTLGVGGWLFDPRTGSLRSGAARTEGGDA